MAEHSEPTLTDADRELWRLYIAGERAIMAVAERMVWIEAERERLRASDETNQERVMHVLGIVDGLTKEREQLVRERDEARSEVEQMHARADRATAELLALGRELKQAREEAKRLRDSVNPDHLSSPTMEHNRHDWLAYAHGSGTFEADDKERFAAKSFAAGWFRAERDLSRERDEARAEQARLLEAEWVLCGATYQDEEAERITEALRETEGFATGLGCRRPLKMKYAFRCAECGRWFDRKCIAAHFATHTVREGTHEEATR